jgi:hypothetical protein
MAVVVVLGYILEFILQQTLELEALAVAGQGDLILAPAEVTAEVRDPQTLVVVVVVEQELANQLLVAMAAAE